MVNPRPILWGMLFACSSFLFMGCETNNTGLTFVPASGIITLDGVPLVEADVEFVPQDIQPNENGLGGSGGFANTDDQGRFEMYTASNAGVEPGTYLVKIRKTSQPEITDPEARVPPGKEMVPAQYNSKSDLVVELGDRGDTEIKFDLKSN